VNINTHAFAQKAVTADVDLSSQSNELTPTGDVLLPSQPDEEAPTSDIPLPSQSDEEAPTNDILLPSQSDEATPTSDIPLPSQPDEATPTEKPDVKCLAEYLLGNKHADLNTLRKFRDKVLSRSDLGMELIESYYQIDESIISLFNHNPAFKNTAEKALQSIIPAVELLLSVKRE
jgi:hypothetical protein